LAVEAGCPAGALFAPECELGTAGAFVAAATDEEGVAEGSAAGAVAAALAATLADGAAAAAGEVAEGAAAAAVDVGSPSAAFATADTRERHTVAASTRPTPTTPTNMNAAMSPPTPRFGCGAADIWVSCADAIAVIPVTPLTPLTALLSVWGGTGWFIRGSPNPDGDDGGGATAIGWLGVRRTAPAISSSSSARFIALGTSELFSIARTTFARSLIALVATRST
jgi:hypothetical protein